METEEFEQDEDVQVIKKVTMYITADSDFNAINGEVSCHDCGSITIYPKGNDAQFLDFSIISIEDYSEED